MISKHKGEVKNDDTNIIVSVLPVCSPSICVLSLVSSFMDGPMGLKLRRQIYVT